MGKESLVNAKRDRDLFPSLFLRSENYGFDQLESNLVLNKKEAISNSEILVQLEFEIQRVYFKLAPISEP